MKITLSHLNSIFLLFLFSLIGMKAFFHPGLFTAHDIWHQVVRLYYYSQAFHDGQILPLWIGQLANGFGYPLFFFSYNLPWIFGLPALAAGLQLPETIKLLFFISFLGSGITMYCFSNSLLRDEVAALLVSVLYLWLPYHFLTIFVSASMGISFVFTFLPLILLGIHLLKERVAFGIAVLATGLSGVMLSHIMHLVFLFPLVFVFSVWELSEAEYKLHFLRNIVLGIFLSVLISSFYLVPAYFYSNATRVAQETGFSTLYQRNFINLSQLLYSKWGYSPIINNAKAGEISFQIGIAQWLSIFLLSLLFSFKKLRLFHKLSICIVIIFLFYIFLMLDYSETLWRLAVKYVTIDYPFRLLLPVTFMASFAAGIVFVNISKFKFIFLILIILVAVYTNRNHINVNQYTNYPISDYLNLETEKTTNTFNEYLPRGVDGNLLNLPWKEISGEGLTTSNTKQRTNSLSFEIEARNQATASAGQFHFPGQTVYLDGLKVNHYQDRQGRISFTVPPGKHLVEIRYLETNLIIASKILSVSGVSILIFLTFYKLALRKKRTF